MAIDTAQQSGILTLDEIAEMGEESGREEAACDFPFLPHNPDRRVLKWYGRGRAQGLYGLRGKAARVFSQNWAIGYDANVSIYEEEYSENVESAREE